MKPKIIIIIAIFLVAGGGVFYYLKKKSANNGGTTVTGGTDTGTGTGTGTNTGKPVTLDANSEALVLAANKQSTISFIWGTYVRYVNVSIVDNLGTTLQNQNITSNSPVSFTVPAAATSVSVKLTSYYQSGNETKSYDLPVQYVQTGTKSSKEIVDICQNLMMAMDRAGTDETAIFNALTGLNKTDLENLLERFGTPNYPGILHGNSTLGQWLKYELTDSEYAKVVEIFNKQGVSLV